MMVFIFVVVSFDDVVVEWCVCSYGFELMMASAMVFGAWGIVCWVVWILWVCIYL